MAEFRKGDIVRNIYTSEDNPYSYLLYIGKGAIKQGRYTHKVYNCIAYDGKKVQLYCDNEPIVAVWHMQAYDKFIEALRELADGVRGIGRRSE